MRRRGFPGECVGLDNVMISPAGSSVSPLASVLASGLCRRLLRLPAACLADLRVGVENCVP